MPAYAGFNDILDYLTSRCARENLTPNSLSVALGFHRSYISSILERRYVPSRNRCVKIADHFGDDPHLLRVLSGWEAPAIYLEDRQVREIYTLALGLSPAQRRQAIKYLRALTDQASD